MSNGWVMKMAEGYHIAQSFGAALGGTVTYVGAGGGVTTTVQTMG